jgi:U6 snRNA m6A methyltransferase
VRSFNDGIHPRSAFCQNVPSLAWLRLVSDELAPFARPHEAHSDGSSSKRVKWTLDWSDAAAQRAWARTLLDVFLGMPSAVVQIPEGRLVPTIPSRLNYVLYVEDLVRTLNPLGVAVLGLPADLARRRTRSAHLPPLLDIGTGATAIYCLLANRMFGWRCIGTEIDADSLDFARSTVLLAGMNKRVKVVSSTPHRYVRPALESSALGGETVSFVATMCNPPFFEDLGEAESGPRALHSASESELVFKGGDEQFIREMVRETALLQRERKRGHVALWHTSLVGRKSSLEGCLDECRKGGATVTWTGTLRQGKTLRWVVAWSYLPPAFLSPLGSMMGGAEHREEHAMEWEAIIPDVSSWLESVASPGRRWGEFIVGAWGRAESVEVALDSLAQRVDKEKHLAPKHGEDCGSGNVLVGLVARETPWLEDECCVVSLEVRLPLAPGGEASLRLAMASCVPCKWTHPMAILRDVRGALPTGESP